MTPLESMRVVAGHFNALGVPYAFLGAAVLPLLVDDPELSEIRPTKDVDLTVKVVTLGELYQLEEKLRAAGFRNDTREGAPICRWVVSGVTVDVMPGFFRTDEVSLARMLLVKERLAQLAGLPS